MFLVQQNNRKEVLPIATVTNLLNVDNETFTVTTSTWNTNDRLDTKRTITLTANTTLTITNSVNGQKGYLIVTQNSTGGFTLTLPNNSKGNSYIDKRANAVSLLTYVFDGTNYNWNSAVTEDDRNLRNTVIDHCLHDGYEPIFLGNIIFNGSYAYTSQGTSTSVGVVTLDTGSNPNGIFGYKSSALSLGSIAYSFRCIFRVPNLSNVTDSYFTIIGFSDALNSANTSDNTVDGIYLYYDQTNANFRYITKSNSVTTNQDSGLIVASNTFYELNIVINKAGTSAVFSINNANNYTATTNIPTGNIRNTGIAVLIAKSLGTATRQLEVDYIQFSYDKT